MSQIAKTRNRLRKNANGYKTMKTKMALQNCKAIH
jgi:hypothetical protein